MPDSRTVVSAHCISNNGITRLMVTWNDGKGEHTYYTDPSHGIRNPIRVMDMDEIIGMDKEELDDYIRWAELNC